MHTEYSILKAFLSHEVWVSLSKGLESKDFPEDLQPLYLCLNSFHQTNEESLHLLDLKNLFFSSYNKDTSFYEKAFDELSTYEPNVTTVATLIKSLKQKRLMRELSITSYEVAEGKKDFSEIQNILSKLETPEEETEEDEFVSDDLDVILDSTYRTPGLKWRLNALNRALGSLRPGDFGFVFARPEVGKTTFLADQVSYMAEQADGNVLWVNNEETSYKVKNRVYQAALGATQEQLLSNPAKYTDEYLGLVGNKILIKKDHVTRKEEIERLCAKFKPKLIIIDTLDNVTGFKADREDLLLGAIYKWARGLAAKYGPVIAVCHADGTAEGEKWLTMSHVANAKTEKQKHADFIIGIGMTHVTGWEKIRFLSFPKNKLQGDAGITEEELRHGHMEVLIDPIHARYADIK